MKPYLNILERIKDTGTIKPSRAGDTKFVLGDYFRWNMTQGFPLLTLKKTSFHNIAHELLWFLGAFDEEWQKFGNTNIRYLVNHNVNIWNADAYRAYVTEMQRGKHGAHLSKEDFVKEIKNNDEFALEFGDLGDTYGAQWRRWGQKGNEYSGKNYVHGIDQIEKVINNLKSNPLSRRHLVTAWNPSVVDDLVLAPCHYGFTLNATPLSEEERMKLYRTGKYSNHGVKLIGGTPSHEWIDDYSYTPKYKLSLIWNQRSVDVPLGLPYNIASYALLLTIISHFTNMVPDKLIGSLEDTHYYLNQEDGVDEMISRRDKYPRLPSFELVNMEGVETIDDIRIDNFKVIDYNSMDRINIKLSVGLDEEE